ncbi:MULTISPECIES: hypothetical protein [Cyanophyceae]|uniref:hypothetical protein n=2 Tax=Cyanobacteriota TaxID=1117 RepID=UPI0016897ABA|nr:MULTISPECIES: hypothetical protein [Cyanophyceae]MBD1914678.1 hypothetical protein [Phormidium sp. FACHB-77]MBD2032566.1 hypothetical protein [Phormidium sp. FACHB-322]MBD2049424.1 hypothetical protein [Leptolyngbya sp. FACHB-60]
MHWSSNLEQFLNQLSELQRGSFSSFNAAVSDMQKNSMTNAQGATTSTLKLQEEVVSSSLELQALLARLTLENQKQLWDGYFGLFRNL